MKPLSGQPTWPDGAAAARNEDLGRSPGDGEREAEAARSGSDSTSRNREESAEGRTRSSTPGAADGGGSESLACAGLSAQNPGDVRGAGRGHWTIREDLGPDLWEPWCVGCLDPRVGKRLGPKRRGQGPWSEWAGVWQREVSRMGRAPGAGSSVEVQRGQGQGVPASSGAASMEERLWGARVRR